MSLKLWQPWLLLLGMAGVIYSPLVWLLVILFEHRSNKKLLEIEVLSGDLFIVEGMKMMSQHSNGKSQKPMLITTPIHFHTELKESITCAMDISSTSVFSKHHYDLLLLFFRIKLCFSLTNLPLLPFFKSLPLLSTTSHVAPGQSGRQKIFWPGNSQSPGLSTPHRGTYTPFKKWLCDTCRSYVQDLKATYT